MTDEQNAGAPERMEQATSAVAQDTVRRFGTPRDFASDPALPNDGDDVRAPASPSADQLAAARELCREGGPIDGCLHPTEGCEKLIVAEVAALLARRESALRRERDEAREQAAMLTDAIRKDDRNEALLMVIFGESDLWLANHDSRVRAEAFEEAAKIADRVAENDERDEDSVAAVGRHIAGRIRERASKEAP